MNAQVYLQKMSNYVFYNSYKLVTILFSAVFLGILTKNQPLFYFDITKKVRYNTHALKRSRMHIAFSAQIKGVIG
jgi:hypothetical protein